MCIEMSKSDKVFNLCACRRKKTKKSQETDISPTCTKVPCERIFTKLGTKVPRVDVINCDNFLRQSILFVCRRNGIQNLSTLAYCVMSVETTQQYCNQSCPWWADGGRAGGIITTVTRNCMHRSSTNWVCRCR